jgi:carbamoyl-phosphate synthase small subunit
MAGRSLAASVSTSEPYVFSDQGRARVAVVDYGCKRSILQRLAAAGAAVTVFPHTAEVRDLHTYDGILLSNGPGDPEPLHDEVDYSRWRPGTRPTSCRSDTAGPTIRCSTSARTVSS